MMIETNKYQTKLTKELKSSLPKEVWEQMLEYITSVSFISWLIQPEELRGYAKDRPRHKDLSDDDENKIYNDNRIVVDITKPHILENMDFFRERAIFFEKNGKYTNLIPNPNPKSDYTLFWKEELRRWKHGLVRQSDGEWIPGELYFYWNYTPIWLNEKVNDNKTGKTRAERVYKFPKPWLGDYLFHHYVHHAKEIGKHGKLLKARGIGMSFKAASWSPRNMYIHSGSGNPNFHLASDKTFLSGDKGIWGKILDTLDWLADHTPLPRMRLVDGKRSMEVQLGYEDEFGRRKGLLSSVYGISMKDNPDKARGIRGPLIHYEEDGLFPNLEAAWNINRNAVERGDVTYGFMIAAGTGGVEGASFEGSEKLFYNGKAYNIHTIPNVYDKNINGETECGFFWGAYLNYEGCYDELNGEPDIIKSLVEILQERYIVKYNSSDARALTQKKAELPITPQEAIMRTEGTIFPVADLKEYLESITPNKERFLSEHYTGELVYSSLTGEVEWKPNADIYPLRSYDSTGDKTGAVEIFEMPKKDSNNKVFSNRYIGGIDPIDADEGQSLFSIFIMDLWTDRIVAEYSGRPRLAKDAYEISLKLLKFYNAEANYEKNLKGLFSYFDNKHATHYLCDTPQILKDMGLVKNMGVGNSAKGTHANAQINAQARLWQADWMNSEAYTSDEENKLLNLHKLRSLAYIEECIKWNSDGNFDRVSAAGMLFILREDRLKRVKKDREDKENQAKTLANDSYFERNYKKDKIQASLTNFNKNTELNFE